jgi:hypothetical protein
MSAINDMIDACWDDNKVSGKVLRSAEREHDRLTRAAYEAQMSAARVVYDAAVFNKLIGNCTAEVALMIVFHQVAGEYAERKA